MVIYKLWTTRCEMRCIVQLFMSIKKLINAYKTSPINFLPYATLKPQFIAMDTKPQRLPTESQSPKPNEKKKSLKKIYCI